MAITLKQLSEYLAAELRGEGDAIITSVATLSKAGAGQLSFLSNPKYKSQLVDTKAGVVLISESEAEECPVNALIVKDPYLSYAKAVALIYPEHREAAGIHPSAVVDSSASVSEQAWIAANAVIEASAVIGDGVQIGSGSVIGRNVHIADNTLLHANVSIYANCKIGSRCIIHSGATVGADGFGFANDSGAWVKIQQVGAVSIGNDVEIGANTSIDCGAIDDTVIEDGVKLDNLIQIGHNVHIGQFTAVASHTAIAGSTIIGKNCTIAGAVAIAGHIEICDNVFITGMSMVSKTITESGVYSSAIPAEKNKEWNKRVARFSRLDRLIKRVQVLENDKN